MANRLKDQESPYLIAHANDPIDWYYWGEEAFNKAKELNRPIFLSIGYSSWHWCHVMQKESFINEEIAKVLNDNFIAIKVDKEERVDIDRHFQEVYNKMNGKGGGWPLSVFITPNRVPIYSATYIPPIANYGKMGFKELLNIISDSWNRDSKILESKGMQVLDALRAKNKIEATKIHDGLVDVTIKQIKQVYDSVHGGFGSAPKFPHASTLELALDMYSLTSDNELKDIVTHTLDSMSMGGIYDIVEGGFCRYSTDDIWLVPHFEKMLYDNAQLLAIYAKAYRVTKISRYRDIAIDSAEFILNNMSNNFLFFSASDADTNGIEGEYFTYSYSEVKEAFKKSDIDTSLLYELSITRNGNFDGKSIARYLDKSLIGTPQVKKAIAVLKDLRDKKEYPFIDKKVITSWSSMAISALFELSKIEPIYKDIALKYLKTLKEKMQNGNLLYHSAMPDNRAKIEGFLEDYAYYIQACIAAFNSTLDEIYLIDAIALSNEAIRLFYKNGRWQVGNLDYKNFVDDFDSSYPSPLSVMVDNLLSIRSLGEAIYEKFAYETLQVQSYNLMRQPISRPKLANCAIRYLKDDKIVKSNIDNLVLLQNEELVYPYILFKPVNSKKIEICNSKSCFASLDSIKKAKEML
jgi:uncharacterized protein YyaL (SSP411 family)